MTCPKCWESMGDDPVCRCGWRRLILSLNRDTGCMEVLKWHVEGSGVWVQVPKGCLVAFGSVQVGLEAVGGAGGRGGVF